MLRFARFKEADIAPFLRLAEGEGWLCERWEFEFLLQYFPQGCLVCREGDRRLGYITSIGYGSSGWIGNLMVHPEARRRGIGRALMERVVSILRESGAATLWLTASEQGAGLYRNLGFREIDRINRWSGQAEVRLESDPADLELELLRAVDRIGWGDWRDALLRVTCGRGTLYTASGGFLCCQKWSCGTQIGPWGCLFGSQAGQLLDKALHPGEDRVFLDVPARNFTASALLTKRGFSVTGSTLLMYLGAEPSYSPGNIFALASMGSMG